MREFNPPLFFWSHADTTNCVMGAVIHRESVASANCELL